MCVIVIVMHKIVDYVISTITIIVIIIFIVTVFLIKGVITPMLQLHHTDRPRIEELEASLIELLSFGESTK